ncbi:probable cinnamyl alcohol dehydrogenase 6 [Tanacetum coccineum]
MDVLQLITSAHALAQLPYPLQSTRGICIKLCLCVFPQAFPSDYRPRHEITGLITEVGSDVKGFKIGDRVGVGCLATLCLECDFCKGNKESYCDQPEFTYNGIFWDGSITYGGYSEMLVDGHRLGLVTYANLLRHVNVQVNAFNAPSWYTLH